MMSPGKIYNLFFSKEIYYLYAMSVYHILILIFYFLGIKSDPQIFYSLTLLGNHPDLFSYFSTIRGIIESYVLVLYIFIIDVGFLIVLMLEFKWLRLNYKKILFAEIIIISLTFFFPILRDVMFFLSFNSVGIYIIYRLILKSDLIGWFFKFPFLLLVYSFIIKLIIIGIIGQV